MQPKPTTAGYLRAAQALQQWATRYAGLAPDTKVTAIEAKASVECVPVVTVTMFAIGPDGHPVVNEAGDGLMEYTRTSVASDRFVDSMEAALRELHEARTARECARSERKAAWKDWQRANGNAEMAQRAIDTQAAFLSASRTASTKLRAVLRIGASLATKPEPVARPVTP